MRESRFMTSSYISHSSAPAGTQLLYGSSAHRGENSDVGPVPQKMVPSDCSVRNNEVQAGGWDAEGDAWILLWVAVSFLSMNGRQSGPRIELELEEEKN